MNEYLVKVEVIDMEFYAVQADSEEEARENWSLGELISSDIQGFRYLNV